jgi:hypothetical protein
MVVFKINDNDFSAMVVKIERSADKLDKYAERTLDGVLRREVIGTYVNYKLTFGNNVKDNEKYKSMFRELVRPADFVKITIPVEDKEYTFEGYIASVRDSIVYLGKNKRIYEGLECDIVAKSPTWTAGKNAPLWG